MPQAQTVTIAQALQSDQSGLTVQDTAANIVAALPNPALVARVSLFELSAPATIGTAAAGRLAALGAHFAAGYPLAVLDSLANMTSPGNQAGLALATTRGVADTAYALLSAPPGAFARISSVTMSGTPTLSATQLGKLEALPGFSLAAGAHFTLSDTLAAAAPVVVTHPGWFAAAAAVTVRLDGSQVSAGVAVALASLANGGKTVSFVPGGGNTTLNINAAAHDLAGAASSLNRMGQLVGVRITVSNDGSAISAADAVALTTVAGFAPAQHTLTVADSGAAISSGGAALFNHGYPQILVTSGTLRAIAALLLDPTLHFAAGATASLTGTPTLTATQMQVLAGLPGFAVAAGATLTVADTISHILAHSAAMTAATTIVATDSETIGAAGLAALGQIATSHPGHFSLAGHTLNVADTPANLAFLAAQGVALPASYALSANGTVTAAQFLALRDGLHVAANGHTLNVSDTAAHLLSLSGNLALDAATQMSADGTVSAAGAASLAGDPAFSTGGHVLTIRDSAAALLGLSGAVQALAGALVLAGSQSVNAAQVTALAALGAVFSTGGAALTVTDTAANLLALPVGVSGIASAYALSADASVSAAQFTALYSPLHVALNGHVLTVLDTPANLLTIPGQALGQAGAFGLTAGGTVNEAQFATLRDGLGVSANGNSLIVADTAPHLLALSGDLSLVGGTHLTADATVTAAGAQSLAADPSFGTAGHVLGISDTAANLLALPGGVAALSGHLALSGDAGVSAAQAGGLAALGAAFSTGGHALVVTDTATALLALSPGVIAIASGYALSADATVSAASFATLSAGLSVALAGHALMVVDTPAHLLAIPAQYLGGASGFALSTGGTVSEAQFATLRDTLGVAANGHSLTVADTASGLLSLSGDLSLDGATQLSANANVTAAQAQTLVGDPNFSTGDATLIVTDTAGALLEISPAVSAVAWAYVLSAAATVSAAQFVTLVTTLNVDLTGHGLSVSDTPSHLLALSAQVLSHASAVSLSSGGTVSEAQLLALRDTLGVAGNGHTLVVADSAANLLALSGNLSLVGSTVLSGPGTVSAAQAVTLAGEPGFSAGGQVLTVSDTAANLLGLPTGVQSLSGHLVLGASQSVSAGQITALAGLGAAFSTGLHVLTVTDTAPALLGLGQDAEALAGAYALSADAVVDAAQFTALTGTLGVGLNGHALGVLDTPAHLLALPAQSLGQAAAFTLSAGGTVSQAQFVTLRDVLGVTGNGHTLSVADTATNLLSLTGDLSLIGATQLSADANVSAAQAVSLAGEPNFTLGAQVLTVTDTAGALLGLPGGVATLSGHLSLVASQSVTAAQVISLTALGSAFSTGGHVLTVTDTAANLFNLGAGLPLAGAYALSGDATVTGAQFSALVSGLDVALNGHALTVADAPAALLALAPQTLSQASAFLLTAGGTVSAAQLITLRDTLGVQAGGHTLSVADSAANLLALSGSLALVGATQITADATVSAAQAQILAADPGFSAGGHVLSVSDTAANLLALTSDVQTLSGHLLLSASQSVSAAQITALAALGAAFSTGGATLTVSDTAANLLSLTSGAAALAGAYALGAAASVTVAQFTTLTATLHVGLAGYALIVSDTPANLLGVPAQALGSATGFALSATGVVNESQFVWLRDTMGVAGNGHTLSVADSAANLLALGGDLSLAGATALTGDATLSAAQAQILAGDPGFSTNGHILTVSDNAANLLALPTEVQTLSGHLVLAASQSINGVQAFGLAALGAAFSTGGNTLTVTDTAANLLSLPFGVGAIAGAYALSADATVDAAALTTLFNTLHVALNGHALSVADTPANLLGVPAQAIGEVSFVLTTGGTVSEAQFVTLRDTFAVNAGGNTLTISDTAADLLALSGNLALDGTTQLSTDATFSAAQAVALAGEPGFSVAGHVLSISDTAANLLALSTAIQTLSGHLVLSASQSVSAAQAIALAALGGAFSTGGSTLTVSDTAANLLALPVGVGAIAGVYALSADASVNAAQFSALRDGLNIALNGHAVTIVDTAGNLAALTGSLADASATILSANGTVSAAGAAVLAAEPGFSTAGHTLTIADTVANLLALSGPLQSLASGFSLSADQTATVAQLAGLAAYGIKFATGGHALGVADTAANLAGLSAPELALVSSETMSQSATVGAAMANTLAALPGFALGTGVSMIVQDSVANLLALSPSALNVASTEKLPAGAVTLSASQAAGLAGLAHFSTVGATITVADSVGALNGNSGWSNVAAITHVIDTAANLAAYAATALVQNADAVSLSFNATISAAQAGALASIDGFSAGGYTLNVADSAVAIAQNATAIAAVADLALVNATTAVSAAQADALAVLSSAGKLNFQAGDALTVSDSYAALTSNANASGLALASHVMVTDNAANLVSASSHDWGGLVPTYVLSADASITGAQAVTLAALGSHFQQNGHTLAVYDSAANVVADDAALTSLGIAAVVQDSAANIGAQANALAGLGAQLSSVQVNDSSAISGAVAAGLAPLSAKLSGAVAVADSAAGIDAHLSALLTLGGHVAITVSDSAASVGADAADLATLGSALNISLTTGGPFSAAATAALAPVAAQLAASVGVSDTVANIATLAGTLSGMGAALGTVSLSGGNAASAAQAVSLASLQSHLANSVQLAISIQASDASADYLTLQSLRTAGHVASITDSGESISAVVSAAVSLNLLGATVNVTDTLVHFNAAGQQLTTSLGTNLGSVTIGDTANPSFFFSLSQYSSEAGLLAHVSNSFSIVITDTAATIEADLASSSPVLTGIAGLAGVAVSGGAPLVLSQAVATTPAVVAVLANFSGTLDVTGVDVAHLGAVALLPAAITLTDSTANIGADLASGNSVIVTNVSAITAITVTGGGNISLTANQALAAGVDDSAQSVFGKLSGAGLVVTGAGVGQVAALLASPVAPASIAVNDTAANITAALINPASAIMTSPGAILSLHVSDGGTITLTEAQDVAAGVNDGAQAALAKVSGGLIDVTAVTAAQLAAVEGGAVVPDQISLSDTGADIAGALSTLLADLSNLGPITITAGSVILTAAQAVMTHVADGAGSLVSLLPGQSYGVSGVSVSQIAALISLVQAPATLSVSDTSANVAADIAGAASQIVAHATSLFVGGGTLSLSDAQAHGVIDNANTAALALLGTGQTIDITGVPVSDIATFSALAGGLAAGVTLHLDISDTALALATDQAQGGASVLSTDAAYVHSVALSASGGTLSTAQLSAVAGIAGLDANGVSVAVSGNAANIASLGAGARTLAGSSVTVSDTAGGVSAQLASLQTVYNGHLAITLTSGTLTVTAANYTADQPSIAAITNTACVIVTGGASAIAAIEASLGTDVHVSAVQLTDSAVNIVGTLGTIVALGNALTVTVTDVGTITAPLAQALVNANLAHLVVNSVVVTDTGAQIAAMAESGAADVTFLNANGASLTGDSNVGLVDASSLAALGSNLALNGHVVNVWDTASHLTAAGASATLASLTGSGFVSGIYLKTSGGSVTLTATNALALLSIPGISIDNPDSSVNTITVADTAAHLQSNFASLQTDAGSIAAFVINASATVNAVTLSDMQTLGATTGAGIALTLSDTAMNILTAAAVSSPSVQASAWNLSASASVSSANALTLAALPNFSAAGYTLTVALGSDTALGSVAQANQLGALGAGLIVTGHIYTISGSVSSLSGLSTAGAAVAHVSLSDTFVNIGALSSSSPLLSGTIAVTDAQNFSAATAQSFLALLSAAGVADGNVNFTGGNETVTDTVAGLQALSGSGAWTGNAALQSHFTLQALDTAANLDNPANASFLAGVPSKVLSASATVSAANATALAALSGFALGGHTLTVSDSAANLLASANISGLALATSITLSGTASLNAAQAEQLLQINHFSLTQTLNVTDHSANLLDGTLSGLIAGHAQVHVSLAGSETMDAQTAASLVALQGFSDTTDMNIVDDSSYLLAPGASAAEAMAASVSLTGDESVSANTILRLSQIPHFIATGGTLSLAGNDYANAPTLKAIADMGSHFSEAGHTLSLTQDDLGLTPTEYAAIQADGFVANGHVISAQLVNDSVSDASNSMTLSATGVSGASVNVYDHGGNLLSSTVENTASFTVTAPDSGSGANFSITETVAGVESAPVVVLNASTLEGLVSGASASFSNSGQIQVGSGEFLNLYTAGASLPNAPALVYDPGAHTISLDIPSQAPVVLITLGATTHPASIDPTEILVKHHS